VYRATKWSDYNNFIATLENGFNKAVNIRDDIDIIQKSRIDSGHSGGVNYIWSWLYNCHVSLADLYPWSELREKLRCQSRSTL